MLRYEHCCFVVMQGKGEITVSATSPVRVYGYHRISCDGCTGRATEMNVPKQAPEEEEDDVQSPAVLLPAPVQDKPSSSPAPPPLPPPLGPKSSSVPPLDEIAGYVDDDEITPMPAPPKQNDGDGATSSGLEKGEEEGQKEEESVYIAEGGDLFVRERYLY